MPQPPLSDEECLAAVRLHAQYGTAKAVAEATGVKQAAVEHRLKVAAQRGFRGTRPVLAGYEIKSVSTQLGPSGDLQREWIKQGKEAGETFEVPAGHTIKGVSALLDADGRTLQQWVKTKEEPSAVDIAAALKEAFADYSGSAVPQPAPVAPSADILTLLPCNDWHVGMFAYGKECGENWDLKIAESVIGRAVEDLIERSPSSGHAVVLGGGDLLHADNQENRTARSGNQLDVDGRWSKVLMTAARLMVRTTDAALRRNEHVIVRILKGNHDEHAAVAVAYFLLAWYRNEPRVTVDADPSLFWWHRFGQVMLGATHGHTVKPQDMPSIMAHRRATDWGQTRFRYVHTFHIHHKKAFATEGNGVITETHQAPIPQDSWHFGSGFLSGRSLQSITYHRAYGEISRARVAILDAAEQAA